MPTVPRLVFCILLYVWNHVIFHWLAFFDYQFIYQKQTLAPEVDKYLRPAECHFRWRWQCATEILLLNASHNQHYCRHADDASLMQFAKHILPPTKSGKRPFSWQRLEAADTCHQDNMVTWQHGGLYSNSKVHGANMGPTWGRRDPGGPHIGPMSLAIWDSYRLKL